MQLKALVMAMAISRAAPMAMAWTPLNPATQGYSQSVAQVADYAGSLGSQLTQYINATDARAILVERFAAAQVAYRQAQATGNRNLAVNSESEMAAVKAQLANLSKAILAQEASIQMAYTKFTQVPIPADVLNQVSALPKLLTVQKQALEQANFRYSELSLRVSKLNSLLNQTNPADPAYAAIKVDLSKTYEELATAKAAIAAAQAAIQNLEVQIKAVTRLAKVPAAKEVVMSQLPNSLASIVPTQDQHGNLLTQIGSLKTQLMLAKDKVQGQYLQQELSRIQAADAKARTLLEFSRAALKTVASRTLELTQ